MVKAGERTGGADVDETVVVLSLPVTPVNGKKTNLHSMRWFAFKCFSFVFLVLYVACRVGEWTLCRPHIQTFTDVAGGSTTYLTLPPHCLAYHQFSQSSRKKDGVSMAPAALAPPPSAGAKPECEDFFPSLISLWKCQSFR